ncbi:hypothetical protein JCM18237_24280 [Halorubrum luteum]
MSTETLPSTVRAPARVAAAQCRRLTVGGVRATAFWAAVFLPLVYVPAAYTVDGSAVLLALLALHMACVVIGHEHNLPADHE